MHPRSAAWDRFWESTKIGSMEWHEGIGYDLEALRAMTDAERAEVVLLLGARPQDWRAVEAYGVVNTTEARAALGEALRSGSAETRLHAANKLHDLGEPIALDEIGAKELSSVTLLDGMSVALRIAARVPTPAVRRALLDGARDRPEVAFHFAATLCSVAGLGRATFGSELRPFLLRLGPHSPRQERRAAFGELCRRLGMTAEEP